MARTILTGATALIGALLAVRPAPVPAAGLDMMEAYAVALGLAGPATTEELGATPLVLAAAPLPPEDLDGMRGGFALPGGLEIAFGFDIATRLGGEVVQRLTLPMTQIGSGPVTVQVNDNGTLGTVDAGSGPVVLDRRFNADQTRILTSLDRGVVGLVQNSASGQQIQRRAEFQVDISGMRTLLRSAGSRRMIDGALAGGTGRQR